jgi:hypothetical protein
MPLILSALRTQSLNRKLWKQEMSSAGIGAASPNHIVLESDWEILLKIAWRLRLQDQGSIPTLWQTSLNLLSKGSAEFCWCMFPVSLPALSPHARTELRSWEDRFAAATCKKATLAVTASIWDRVSQIESNLGDLDISTQKKKNPHRNKRTSGLCLDHGTGELWIKSPKMLNTAEWRGPSLFCDCKRETV